MNFTEGTAKGQPFKDKDCVKPLRTQAGSTLQGYCTMVFTKFKRSTNKSLNPTLHEDVWKGRKCYGDEDVKIIGPARHLKGQCSTKWKLKTNFYIRLFITVPVYTLYTLK